MKTLYKLISKAYLIAALVSPILSYSQSTWVVSQSGDGNYTTIQEALDNSNEGDTIFVRSGTYKEHLSVSHTLYLSGESPETIAVRLKLRSLISPM